MISSRSRRRSPCVGTGSWRWARIRISTGSPGRTRGASTCGDAPLCPGSSTTTPTSRRRGRTGRWSSASTASTRASRRSRSSAPRPRRRAPANGCSTSAGGRPTSSPTTRGPLRARISIGTRPTTRSIWRSAALRCTSTAGRSSLWGSTRWMSVFDRAKGSWNLRYRMKT